MITISPQSVICTALLMLRNGHVQQAEITLKDAIRQAAADGEDPDLNIMCAANWIDNERLDLAKTVLQKAAWGCR